MYRNEFRSIDQVLYEGKKTATRGIFTFGIFSVILAGLIFLFPAFVGILFALLILLLGMIALMTGYQLSKTGNITTSTSSLFPDFEIIRSEKAQNYFYQTFRCTRW